jgi:hypothetical protein
MQLSPSFPFSSCCLCLPEAIAVTTAAAACVQKQGHTLAHISSLHSSLAHVLAHCLAQLPCTHALHSWGTFIQPMMLAGGAAGGHQAAGAGALSATLC